MADRRARSPKRHTKRGQKKTHSKSAGPIRQITDPDLQKLSLRFKMNLSLLSSSEKMYYSYIDNERGLRRFNPDKSKSDLCLKLSFTKELEEDLFKIIEDQRSRIKGLSVTSLKPKSALRLLPNVMSNEFGLRIFGFQGGRVKDEVLDVLLAELEKNTTIKTLMVFSSTFRKPHFQKLFDTFRKPSFQITDLDLYSNKINEKAASMVADLLTENKTLEVLSLKANEVGTEGAAKILEALFTNKTLKCLDLEDNGIFSPITEQVSEYIMKHNTLRLLNLSHNSIDTEGADQILVAVLLKKVKLLNDYFKGNPKDFEKFSALKMFKERVPDFPAEVQALMKEFADQVIGDVNLSGNSVSEEKMKALHKALDAPSVMPIRMHSTLRRKKLTWQREAWQLASSEMGPKYLKDLVTLLFQISKRAVKDVVQVKNQDKQNMVEVLLKNPYANQDVYELVKFLCVQCKIRPEDKDSIGRPFIEVMRHHENISIRRWANEMNALDGLYELETVPPIHISTKAEVVLAKNVKTNEEVVLKLFRERDDWAHETEVRNVLNDDVGGNKGFRTRSLKRELRNLLRQQKNDKKKGKKEKKKHCEPFIVKILDSSPSKSQYFYHVYSKADRSLFEVMNKERIAGLDLKKVQEIMKKGAMCLTFVNGKGFCHGDFKPSSLMRVDFDSNDYKLVDFVSSYRHGEPMRGYFPQAYIPPEAAMVKFVTEKRQKANNVLFPDPNGIFPLTITEDINTQVISSEKFDVWSFGVVLFELLSGTMLFESLRASDKLATPFAKADLVNWLEISSTMLERVLEIPENKLKTKEVFFARELVRWCLQRDPEMRPTFRQILRHPFFTGAAESEVELSKNFKTHMFLSHIQRQASGTVKDVYYCASQLGCSAWLDMKAGQITQQAMYDGVKNTEAFVVCLTTDTFFSFFCLKELMWAIDCDKKIIFLTEVDGREGMSPFKLENFIMKFDTEEQLIQLSHNLGDFNSLMLTFKILEEVEQNEEKIEQKYDGDKVRFVLKEIVLKRIKEVWSSEAMIPYRRREYENRAMMNFLLHTIGFVPPSDPILDDRDELSKDDLSSIMKEEDKVVNEFLDIEDEEDDMRMMVNESMAMPASAPEAMSFGGMFEKKRAQKKARKGLEKVERHRRRKNFNKRRAKDLLRMGRFEEAKLAEEEAYMKNSTIFVLVGDGEAANMVSYIKQGVQNFIEFKNINEEWLEYSSSAQIPYPLVEEAVKKGNVAVLCVMTQNFFDKTAHGANILALEECLKRHGKGGQFPVVMVQDGWFNRDWNSVQSEVGEQYNHYLMDVEFMPYRKPTERVYEFEAMVGEVANRLNEYCDQYS